MQIEDPRIHYKQLQNERSSTESIPLQPLHGSPYHVYPASNFPVIKAFQGPNPSLQSVSASPLLSTKSQIQMEMSPIIKQANSNVSQIGNIPRRQTIQETSFTNSFDTDAVVAKINNMFPTASDDHIRLLLKKYYNREAVVISALQVEKNPITMPGPFATPPAQRHLYHSNSAFQMTPPVRRFEAISRSDSPLPGRPCSVANVLYGSPRIGDQFRNSPKPHSSPKMKLRYLKTVFPKADEMLLLDILANSDNNVQKASETLLSMGYQKRDMAPPKLTNRSEAMKKEDVSISVHPKVLTLEEKNAIRVRLQQRYKDIAERIIIMALESVNYSEDRALQILQIVKQEDENKAQKGTSIGEIKTVDEVIREEFQPTSGRSSPKDATEEETHFNKKPEFKSIIGRIEAKGHNPEIAKGPDDSLLLADYVTWNGANPDFSLGQKSIAIGHNPSLLSERAFTTRGHNSELFKGPNVNLPKGSIYSHLNKSLSANVKCN